MPQDLLSRWGVRGSIGPGELDRLEKERILKEQAEAEMGNLPPKGYIDPVSGIPYGDLNLTGEDPYAETRGLDRLEFDPSLTFTNDKGKEVGAYEFIFKPIEKAYADVMKKPLKLSSGNVYSKVWDQDKNLDIEKDLSMFANTVNEIMDKDVSFSNNVIGERRDNLKRDFAKELYSIEQYIKDHPAMPKEGSNDRKIIDKVIKNTLKNSWGNLQHMITSEVQDQGIQHSVDRSYWTERAVPSAKKVLGETAKRFDDEIGTLFDFIDRSGMLSGETPGIGAGGDGVEKWAQRVRAFGDDWTKEGTEALEDPDLEPTGKYAMSMGDLELFDGMLNPKYAVATASESAISNMLISGVGFAASALSPGKKLKIAAGIIGSAIPGYALESSSAETEAKEELINIRRQARIDKKNLSPEEFKNLYTYYLGENYSITADELSDENIEDISNRIAVTYGILSAGVEGLSTGIEVAAASKFFKDMTSIKLISKNLARGTLGKSIMKAKDVGKFLLKGFGVEAVEEATQESLNQYIIGRNVPFYNFDKQRVWKAAYAGGLFGGGMSIATTGVAQVARQYAKTKMDKGARVDLEQRREQAEKGQDLIPEEKQIKAGLFLEFTPENFVERIASIDEETYHERAPIMQLRAGELAATRQEWMSPDDMVKVLKDKNVRENFNITEQKLMMRPGYFNDEQVAEILGIEVSELKFEHTQIKRGKPSKKKAPKTTPKNKKNYSKPKRKGKKSLADIERTQMDETSKEYQNLLEEKNLLTYGIRELQELQGTGKKPEDELRTEIKKLKEHRKKVDSALQKLNAQKPKKKTKDPLAQKKQKLINRVNDLGDEVFTKEQLSELKNISKAKTDKELKGLTKIVDDAQKSEDLLFEAEEKERKVAVKTSEEKLKVLKGIEDDIANFTGDKRTKEFKELKVSRDELEKDYLLSVEESTEELTEESLENQASNIHSVITGIGSIIYNRQQLEQMNDAKLIEIASEEKINSSDRNTIIAKYLDNMGDPDVDDITEMNMGVPLNSLPKILINRVQKTQFFAEMNEAWRQAKERHNLDDYSFDAWVDAIASKQPSSTRDVFLEWADQASPIENTFDPAIDKIITGIFGRSNRFTPQEQDQFGEDIEDVSSMVKETAPKKNDEDSDLSAESENIINTRAFSAFQVNLNTEVFDHIIDSINSGKFETFEDFLNEISDPMYELEDIDGQTPVVAANNDPITRAELYQFYVSKKPENFVPINQGKREGIRKNIEIIYIPKSGKFGKKGVKYKNTKSGYVKTGWGRAMLAENLIPGINDDIVWLDKADLKIPIGKGKFVTRSESLTASELESLTRNEFRKAGLIPLMMRNDSGRLVLAIVKKEHKASALKYLSYWKKEVADNNITQKLADEYMGKNLSEKQMKAIYGSQHDYIAGQISRHETLKKIFGNTYHELTQQEIMLRNSVIFSTTLSNSDGDPSSIYVFDYKKERMGDVQFVTAFEDGSTETIDAVQIIDGVPQYIGDGATWTSERVFKEKYPNEVGALPTAKRAKTVKFGYDESGVLLEKHQEMSFSLPEGAIETSVVDEGLVIAKIRRDPDGINIYVRDEKTGTKWKYVDHLASRDEVKVMTGKKWDNMNKIMSLPSGSTGHIQLTARDKNKANFPMQVLNYLNDEKLLDYVSKIYSSRTDDPISPEFILHKMTEILTDGNKMNDFIRKARASFPGSIPRMIENFANVGAGIHPSVLSLGMAMVKNRLLSKSQDFLQRGGVMDFRPSMTENLKSDEMIASADHGMRRHIAYQLAKKIGKTFKEVNGLNLSELNSLLKKNPIEVMMVRFPVPSQSGFRIMKVFKLEKGLGDSFKVSPKVVKEVFEGDHDHDTGHITILDDELTQMLKDNQVETAGINISKYEQEESIGSIANIKSSTNTMAALTQGKMAIGKIASLQRNYGIINHYLNSITIGGSEIILKSLDTPVVDLDMIIAETGKPEKQSLAMMMRTYAQAAFDNPKLRLLDKWNFTDKKLIEMMFQRSDGSKLTESQINTLSLFMSEHNKASQIRNGKNSSGTLKLSEILAMSRDYKEMVQNRENHIVSNVSERIDESSDDLNYDKLNSINVKEDRVHPAEVRAMAPFIAMESKNIDINLLTDVGNVTSSVSHAMATKNILEDDYRTEMTAKSFGLTVEQFKQLSPKEYAHIAEQVKSGIDWGRAAHSKLLSLYAKSYDNLQDEEQARPIDPNSWDHNRDFNDFYHNLYKEGIGGLAAFNDLSKTQQVAATFAFLDRFITADGIHADYVGKILPVSNDGITLLDPEVMNRYFNIYNDTAKRFILGEEIPNIENIRATKVAETYVKEMRRVYGCE